MREWPKFLARVLVHIPDKGHVTTRYYGWYANRPRGMRRIFEVAPLACPACHGAMRIVACITQASRRHHAGITQASVIDRILTHLRTRPATRS